MLIRVTQILLHMYTIYSYQFDISNRSFIGNHRVTFFCSCGCVCLSAWQINRVECIPVTVAVFDSFVAVNLASALQNCNLLYVNNLVFLFVSLSFSHFFFSIPKRNCPFQTAPPDRLSIQTKHLLFCMTCQFVFRYNLKWANFVSNRCSSLSSQRYRFVRTK